MKKYFIWGMVFSLFTILLYSSVPLTFEERVAAQEAIERVYYKHRIWPKENPGPKPPFEEMVPRSLIETKVFDYIKKSNALGEYWLRPIKPEALQAEIDRMVRNTKNPDMLQQLFDALNNDPLLIAECLARLTLADHLIQNWYAMDDRFHKETREKTEEAFRNLTSDNFSSYPAGDLMRKRYILGEKEPYEENAYYDQGEVPVFMNAEQFNELKTQNLRAVGIHDH